MMNDKILNFLKDKSLLIAILVVTFIVLIDNKSYVYIGPDTFKIEKRPQLQSTSVVDEGEGVELGVISLTDNNISGNAEQEIE